MFRRRLGVLAVVILLMCACEPEATPLPGNLPPREPPTPTPTEQGLPRYALAPNILPYLSQPDRDAIAATAEIVELDSPPVTDDLGARYDIVVALGDLPDGETAPQPLQVSLILNTALPPLNDPDLAAIVSEAVDPQAIARALGVPPEMAGESPASSPESLRIRLANAGYPDGFDLTLAALAPGADALASRLEVVGIHARIVTSTDEPAHLTLTTTPTTGAQPILTIPIRFRAVDGLTIAFTATGFPIATQ